MAFSIQLKKTSDDGLFVSYEYWTTGRRPGVVKIEKSTGSVYIVEQAEGDEGEAQAKRAGFALMKHWKNGEYPEKAHWAS